MGIPAAVKILFPKNADTPARDLGHIVQTFSDIVVLFLHSLKVQKGFQHLSHTSHTSENIVGMP